MIPRQVTILCAALCLGVAACSAPTGGGSEVEPPPAATAAPLVPTPTEVEPPPTATTVTSEPTPTEAVQAEVESAPAEEGPASGDPLFGFKQALVLALSTPPRDYAALTTYMGDSFDFMIWYGNGERMAPAEAATALESTFLPPGSTLTFEGDPDFQALMDENPYQLFGNAADFLWARGWGSSGNDEALLIISEGADGSPYWSGILYAVDGFERPPLFDVPEWVPLPEEMCVDLADSVFRTLGVTATYDTAAGFYDHIEGTAGTCCRVMVTGTGWDFAGHVEVFDQLANMLTTMGWTHDMYYDGGGPTGTMGGFRRDSGLILVLVGWEPAPEAECPPDQPIYACELTPEQMLYTITLSAAMQ